MTRVETPGVERGDSSFTTTPFLLQEQDLPPLGQGGEKTRKTRIVQDVRCLTFLFVSAERAMAVVLSVALVPLLPTNLPWTLGQVSVRCGSFAGGAEGRAHLRAPDSSSARPTEAESPVQAAASSFPSPHFPL